jgi:LPXTG-motif cell wall-anchored protein
VADGLRPLASGGSRDAATKRLTQRVDAGRSGTYSDAMRRFLLIIATLFVLLVPGVASAATNPDYTEEPPKVIVTSQKPAAQAATVSESAAAQTRLAVTGSETMVLVLAGAAAVSVGALVLIGRRRFADVD